MRAWSGAWSTARPWVRPALILLAAAVGAQTLVHLVNRFMLHTTALDVNQEYTVFSLGQGLAIAAAALGCALVLRAGTPPARALVLAGLLGFLAVDEYFVIHERFGARATEVLGVSSDWDSVLWPIAYIPLLGLLLLLLFRLARDAPDDIRRLLVIGVGCLAAAVVLEVLSFPFSTEATADGLVHALEGAVEEALELMGWGLLATGTLTWALTPAWSPAPSGGAGRRAQHEVPARHDARPGAVG